MFFFAVFSFFALRQFSYFVQCKKAVKHLKGLLFVTWILHCLQLFLLIYLLFFTLLDHFDIICQVIFYFLLARKVEKSGREIENWFALCRNVPNFHWTQKQCLPSRFVDYMCLLLNWKTTTTTGHWDWYYRAWLEVRQTGSQFRIHIHPVKLVAKKVW